jgi:hypothetical protein
MFHIRDKISTRKKQPGDGPSLAAETAGGKFAAGVALAKIFPWGEHPIADIPWQFILMVLNTKDFSKSKAGGSSLRA